MVVASAGLIYVGFVEERIFGDVDFAWTQSAQHFHRLAISLPDIQHSYFIVLADLLIYNLSFSAPL